MSSAAELLTVVDVARICRVHEATVRRQISDGSLKSVRVGSAVRVRWEDLEAYLQPGSGPASGADSSPARRSFTADDPLWTIVGMVDEPGEAWVSSDKRRALAEAYAPKP